MPADPLHAAALRQAATQRQAAIEAWIALARAKAEALFLRARPEDVADFLDLTRSLRHLDADVKRGLVLFEERSDA